MPSGKADFTVEIVDANGDPDHTVAVIDGISGLSPSVGDLLVWDGTAWVDRALIDGDIPSTIARESELQSNVWLDNRMFFNLTSGGPSTLETPANVALSMGFDTTALERASTIAKLPSWWATFAVDLWWTNVAASAGGVYWRALGSFKADGETLTALSESFVGAPGVVAAPGAIGLIEVTRLATAVPVVANSILTLAIERDPTQAGDDLANDAGMYGVNLVRLT